MKRVWQALAVVAVGGAVLIWAPWSTKAVAAAEVSADELYSVRRDDLRVTLTEKGEIVAKESREIAAKARSENKLLFFVEAGKEVKEGEVVCKFDDKQAKAALEQTRSSIRTKEAELNSALGEAETQKLDNEAAVKKAEIALDHAKQEIDKYESGIAPQEKNKLEIALKRAQKELARDEKKLDDSRKLFEQKYVSRTELEEDETKCDYSRVEKQGAEVALMLFDKYTYRMTLDDLRTKCADAERELATASKRGATQLELKTVKVKSLEAELQSLNDELKQRQEDVDNMVLTAPCPGVLIHGSPHYRRRKINIGETFWQGETVMTIPDLRVMQVLLQVHEADYSKLKLGQEATVTTDSYPGVLLPGEVTKIATVANAENNYGSSEVKKFDVEVTLRTEGRQLRPGISAKCEIHIETRPKTLFVPLQAVFTEDGEQFCHLQSATKGIERRKLKTGSSNDNWMEVTEGIAEGDRVLLYNPLLASAGRGAKAAGGDKNAERAAPSDKQPAEAAADGASPAAVPATASPSGVKTGS